MIVSACIPILTEDRARTTAVQPVGARPDPPAPLASSQTGDTMEFLEAPPLPFYFTPEHEQFRATLREFIGREITPFVA